MAELGPLTGSGILNMAIVGGGAILPLIQGVMATISAFITHFLYPRSAHFFILFYALSGSKPNSERYARD
jgi:MFS transporter, FHS family, L-fucose permease